MEKQVGEKYNSRWDWSTWMIIGLLVGCCLATWLLAEDSVTLVICVVMLLFVLVTFLSIYYKIEGNNLVVYTLFRPTAYPIQKIKSVKPTQSVLSSPATSLRHRLAITFDREVLKSSLPILISPVRQDEFISALLAVNPDIEH